MVFEKVITKYSTYRPSGVPLEAKERTIVAMKFAASLKNVDIASIMSLGESNVGAIIHRSLKKMRKVLEGEQP
jgi:RNA polymerase sigma-70 factor (ECF subfamily)